MSRTYKRSIYKDIGHSKRTYWRTHRRINKSILKSYLLNDYIPLKDPRVIINDYDYCDFIIVISYRKSKRKLNFDTSE